MFHVTHSHAYLVVRLCPAAALYWLRYLREKVPV